MAKKEVNLLEMPLDDLVKHVVKLGESETRLAVAMLLRDDDTKAQFVHQVAAVAVSLRDIVREAESLQTEVNQDEKKVYESKITYLQQKLSGLPDNVHGVKLREYYTQQLKALESDLQFAGLPKRLRNLSQQFEALKLQALDLIANWDKDSELARYDILEFFPSLKYAYPISPDEEFNLDE